MSIRPAGGEHLSDGTLMEYLDDELEAGRRAGVGRHVLSCRPCGRRLAELRSASDRLSEGLEAVAGDPDFAAGAAGPLSSEWAGQVVRPQELATSRQARSGTGLRRRVASWAAALVVVSAGALAAFPGSPVHAWLSGQIGRLARGEAAGAAASGAPPAPAVSIAPDGGSVSVRLIGTTRATLVRVRLADGADARVTAPGASFRAGPGFVDVMQESGGYPVTIDLPRSLRSARVEVEGRTAVVKEGDRLRAVGAAVRKSDGSLELRGGGR